MSHCLGQRSVCHTDGSTRDRNTEGGQGRQDEAEARSRRADAVACGHLDLIKNHVAEHVWRDDLVGPLSGEPTVPAGTRTSEQPSPSRARML